MTDEQKRIRIHRALNAEFSCLNTTPGQRDHLLARIVEGENMSTHNLSARSTRPRLSLTLILIIVLLSLSMTAFAVGAIINGYYERIAHMEADGSMIRWQLEEKIAFVNAMREFSLEMNEEDYTIMQDSTRSEEDRLAAADHIIYDRYGELIQQDVSNWVQQPDSITEISPDEVIIFTERYLAEHPGGLTSREAYQQYTDELGYFLRDVYYPAFNAAQAELPQVTPPPKGSEAAAINSLKGWMTEIYSWDPEAVDAMVPEVIWDEEYQLWEVSGEVSKESMANAFEPITDRPAITETETGYRLTILADTKGNASATLDKEAFRLEHAFDIEPAYALTTDEGAKLAFAAVMERFSLTEEELNKLFCNAEYTGMGKDNAALYRYVYRLHYQVGKEAVYGVVVNLLTGDVVDVYSYREAEMSVEWRLIYFAAHAEQQQGWYVRWPIEFKKQLLEYIDVCGLLPTHPFWQIAEPSAEEIDAFVAFAFDAEGYVSAVNTTRMIHTLLGSDHQQWTDSDVALYSDLISKYNISTADGLANLDAATAEIDAPTAVRTVRSAFCQAWQLPESTLDAWDIRTELVHDDHLDRGLVYHHVFLTCPADAADTFFGRRSFDYRVLIDGTLMDASMMPEWYSPAQEQATLAEQQHYDNDLWQEFIRYAQENDLLMEYGDFQRWPLAHQKAFADQLRPVIQERISTDPAFADPRLIAFSSHVYGLPEDRMLSEKEAVRQALQQLPLSFALTDRQLGLMRAGIVLLDVTNPAAPVWQIGFSAGGQWSAAQLEGVAPNLFYMLELDALTGTVISAYSCGQHDGQTGVSAWDRWY